MKKLPKLIRLNQMARPNDLEYDIRLGRMFDLNARAHTASRNLTPRPRKIAENLYTSDTLYPVIAMQINQFLDKLGLKQIHGFPGWGAQAPEPPFLGMEYGKDFRKYSFSKWFASLCLKTYRPRETVRIRKSSSCGAPLFTTNVLMKSRICEFSRQNWEYIMNQPELFPHFTARREQYNDKLDKVRKGVIYLPFGADWLPWSYDISPFDPVLKPFGLQRPRIRIPRMVSLFVNYPLMAAAQCLHLSEYWDEKERVFLKTDPNEIVKFISWCREAGFIFMVSWDGKQQEWQTAPNSVITLAQDLHIPALIPIVTNWVNRIGELSFKGYMGNLSGISHVLLINIWETLARMEWLGIVKETGVCDDFAIGLFGDTGFIACRDATRFKKLLTDVKALEGLVELNSPPEIGHKEVVINEDGSIFLRQDLTKLMANFWFPEYDAGSTDRPFYGFGRTERFANYIGDQTDLRDKLRNFEELLISQYRIKIDLKVPPANIPAYDIDSWYKIYESDPEAALALEPYIFAQEPFPSIQGVTI